MEMQECYGGGDGDWFQHPLAALPPLPMCSSSSPSPLLMSEHSCLVIAAAPAADGRGPLADRSLALTLRADEMTGYMPMIPAPVAAADDLYSYPLDALPPLPADLSTAGLDDALLTQPLSFTDIDLEAFVADAAVAVAVAVDLDEQKPVPLDIAIAAPADHYLVAHAPQHPRPTEILNHKPSAARGVNSTGYEHKQQQQQQQARPAARRARRSGGEGSSSAAGAGGGGGGARSLDHIGFEELRKYIYMPITRAAREMNVGLTVLKKRCRELGVARWPHRKIKSLRSLILNIQEMGKGVSSAAVQAELEALERYCARMEENPAIELTEQTKKLRQACFKENYKRRRAAAVNMLDHCYDFGQQQLPQVISRRHAHSASFFGY